MTGITEEDVGFPGSALRVLSLKGNRWLDKPSSVRQFHGESCLPAPSLFCSFPMGQEFENNRNYDDWAPRTIADR